MGGPHHDLEAALPPEDQQRKGQQERQRRAADLASVAKHPAYYDPAITPFRAVVERAIGRIKAWAIFHNIASVSLVDHAVLNDMLAVAVGLHNMEVEDGMKV